MLQRVLASRNAVNEPLELPAPPEEDVRLDEVLAEPGDNLFYDHDFGDGWQHTIRLEEILPPHLLGTASGMCHGPTVQPYSWLLYRVGDGGL